MIMNYDEECRDSKPCHCLIHITLLQPFETVRFCIHFNQHGPVVQRRVKLNPGLDETLNIIPSSRNTSGLSKLLLKNTPRKPKYANSK